MGSNVEQDILDLKKALHNALQKGTVAVGLECAAHVLRRSEKEKKAIQVSLPFSSMVIALIGY